MLPGTPENVSSYFNRKLASVDFTEVPCSDRLHSTVFFGFVFFLSKITQISLEVKFKVKRNS